MASERFTFTISDVALFLGKSPVTLRGWESQGLIEFPRDGGGDRKFTIDDIRSAAKLSYELSRVSAHRLQLVEAALTLLGFVEKENQ